jgi:hypothetical protein
VNFQQRPGAPAATSYVVDMLLPMRTIRSRLPGEALRMADSTVSTRSSASAATTGPTTTTSSFIGLNAGGVTGRRLTPEEEQEWTVVPVAIGSLYQLSSVVLYMPKDLRLQESRLAVARGMKVCSVFVFLLLLSCVILCFVFDWLPTLRCHGGSSFPQDLRKKFPDGAPVLDPVDDMKVPLICVAILTATSGRRCAAA